MNYKYRMHDPRVGRFFAVDPLFKEFAWNSPYAFSENDVIRAIELEGLEKKISTFTINGKVENPNSTELGLVSHRELETAGPLGDGHLYIYENTQDDSAENYYLKEDYGGNLYGIFDFAYAGPDNPTNYEQAPNNEADYGGYKHDKGYDRYLATGPDDAKNNLDVLHVDKQLIADSKKTRDKFTKNKKDAITGKKVTRRTSLGAYAIIKYFKPIIAKKEKALYQILKDIDSGVSREEAVYNYNKKNDTKFTFSEKRLSELRPKERSNNGK